MAEINWADLGTAALIVYLVVTVLNKIPEIIQRIRESSSGAEPTAPENELIGLLENNTTALMELTQFLKTQNEVNSEKTKQSNKQLDTIEEKLDKLIDMNTRHVAQQDYK